MITTMPLKLYRAEGIVMFVQAPAQGEDILRSLIPAVYVELRLMCIGYQPKTQIYYFYISLTVHHAIN
jgi:hypothetical protein